MEKATKIEKAIAFATRIISLLPSNSFTCRVCSMLLELDLLKQGDACFYALHRSDTLERGALSFAMGFI